LLTLRRLNLREKNQKRRRKIVSYYGCGKVGHYKNECPDLAKEKERSG